MVGNESANNINRNSVSKNEMETCRLALRIFLTRWILPPKDLLEKEKYFLDVFEQTAESPEELVTRLGLDRVETAPDDIAALFISKRA